ncbi:MAG: hypothetical protein LBQ03_02505 [Puniceicoccales bacterium]|jgi:hypothetical protein|nr:hypothetical protein [Puniceicoccales bacterium]
MKTNIKIRLLVAALGGSIFSYNNACASDSMELASYDETPKAFDFYPAPYRGCVHIRSARQAPDHASERIPLSASRDFPLAASQETFIILPKDFEPMIPRLRRKATISGVLGNLNESDLIPLEQQERGLAQMIPILIKKHFFDALPAFVDLTVIGFKRTLRERGINECSLEELFTFSLVHPDTFQYVTRDQRPPRESVAIYGYATDAIMGQDGIINRIKRNIMDEILMVIQLLIAPNIPDEVGVQLEQYVDHLLLRIIPPLKQAMFEILRSDLVTEVATCCGWCRKLKKENKESLTRGICHMLGAVFGRLFGAGFEQGADELANGICGIIAAHSEL